MASQRDKVIASAEKLVGKGKIEPAIKEYERLLEDNPNDVNTLNRIGDLWVRINRSDEAVKVFGKIADHYSKDGFFLKAIAIYKKINKLDPSKLDVYARLADLYAKQGLAMEAKSQYQVLADYYVKHGDPGNALVIYRKISELDPNSINVHVKLADLYSQNNQTGDALKEYDRVGRMLLKRGMLDEAVQVFRKALKIDARNVDLVESLVGSLLEAKDYDNAQQIAELALEANRENPRLIASWARILTAKGDLGSARSALERGLASNPTDPAIREALSELYAKQGEADKALEMVVPLLEKALGRGERTIAVDTLNRILRVDPEHVPTLERLAGVYMRLNEETNIITALSSLAEAHISRKRYAEAAKVLEGLIQREPQNAQHRNKLQLVRSQMGAGTTPGTTRPKTEETPAPPAFSMEIEEPPPAFDLDSEPSMDLGLDSSPPLELDLGASEPPPQTAVPPPPPPIYTADESSLPAGEEGAENLDFITEHLTEAEVFAKYGLAEKAVEHLRAVIERVPRHLPAHDRLFRILLDEGDLNGARSAAQQYVALLAEQNETGAVDNVREEFLARGHTLDAEAPSRPKTVERPRPSTLERARPATVERPKTAERPKPPTLEQPAPPQMESDASLFNDPTSSEEISFDLDTGAEVGFDVDSLDLEPSSPPPSPVEFAEPEPVFDIETAPDDFFAPPTAAAASAGGPSVEELGEIDFYIEQELYDDAGWKIDALLALYPDHTEVVARRDRVSNAKAAAAVQPAARSRDEIENELLAAIPADDEMAIPAPPPSAQASPPPPPVVTSAQEGNLFAEEDDFFDLAAELESEMADDEEPINAGEEEQSLEEIFKEFKKGVEQQLDSEDYDTHYNLGIAYKEMGLIDEAIGEFQLAAKDPKRAVECASMLGLCFLEKGMPQLAIKWYRKGLEMPELREEEHIGLLYDLGSAYVEVGDTSNAQKVFMEVYGMNTNYRDVITRIKQLEAAT